VPLPSVTGDALFVFGWITGKEAGHVWRDGHADYTGLSSLLLKDNSRTTFAAWYSEWLKCLVSYNALVQYDRAKARLLTKLCWKNVVSLNHSERMRNGHTGLIVVDLQEWSVDDPVRNPARRFSSGMVLHSRRGEMIPLIAMQPTPGIPTSARAAIIGAIGAALIFQVYVVVSAWWRVPEFENMFRGMGVEVPIVTRALFATNRFWFAVPLIFFIVAADLFRKPTRAAVYVGIVTFAAFAAGFALQAWLNEGCFAPVIQIIHKLG